MKNPVRVLRNPGFCKSRCYSRWSFIERNIFIVDPIWIHVNMVGLVEHKDFLKKNNKIKTRKVMIDKNMDLLNFRVLMLHCHIYMNSNRINNKRLLHQ